MGEPHRPELNESDGLPRWKENAGREDLYMREAPAGLHSAS